MTRTFRSATAVVMLCIPAIASAQINFAKTGYYLVMGDSVAAGEGAMPVTNGYAYQLYEQGTFGQKQRIDFANAAVRGARSWELRDQQVAEVLCAEPAQRPTVVTITAGANDFLRGDTNIPAIAGRVAEAINLLLNKLLTIEKRLGFISPFDFDIHPTNLGHSFIAREFEAVWQGLP